MGPLMAQWKILGPFDDAMGKLETLNKAIAKLGGGLNYIDYIDYSLDEYIESALVYPHWHYLSKSN